MTSMYKRTHRCRAQQWQGKKCERSEDDDDVVPVVPQPLQPTTHDSLSKSDKQTRAKTLSRSLPGDSEQTQKQQRKTEGQVS